MMAIIYRMFAGARLLKLSLYFFQLSIVVEGFNCSMVAKFLFTKFINCFRRGIVRQSFQKACLFPCMCVGACVLPKILRDVRQFCSAYACGADTRVVTERHIYQLPEPV